MHFARCTLHFALVITYLLHPFHLRGTILHPLWWFILGSMLTLIVMAPILRLLLRRGEHRARIAERRARDAERLAELGSMTSGLAHEIKNPLSTVHLNAQILAEQLDELEIPDDRRQRLRKRIEPLQREVERLRNILEDFMQYAGRFQLAPATRNVADIAEDLSAFFQAQCEQSHILLRLQIPDDPILASVDEGLFKQAILNLLINAVQIMSSHTVRNTQQPSSTTVGELILRVTGDQEFVRLHVMDTGPGIPQERIEEIFHPYVSTRKGGTGLGLSIAKRIVEEHGGQLSIDSQLGQGSEFTITLPRVFADA